MATLTSNSSLAQVEAEYDNCAGYVEDASTALCKRFITACTFLVRRYLEASSKGDATMQRRVSLIENQRESAVAWLDGHDTGTGDTANSSTTAGGPRVTRASFQNFRDSST